MSLVAMLQDAITKLPSRDVDFAESILRSLMTGRATEKQEMWAQRLIDRANAPAQETVVINVEGILKLLLGAAARLKYPKVRLTTDEGQRVVLSVAGSRSRHEGSVMITDGKPFGENVYFGRIGTDGVLTPAGAMTPAVLSLLQAFAADPAGIGAVIGRRTGSCCFCSRQLDTKESLAVGYGPVCAVKYDLPWG